MDDRKTEFGEDEFDHAYPNGIQRHYWNRCRNRLVLDLLRHHAPSAKILDIGCGRGIVVDYLRRHGADAWGCDAAAIAPIAADVAPYLDGRCDVLDAPSRSSAKAALLLDVLEHLPAPAEFFARARAGLPDLEIVIITVPARQELWSAWDEAYGHFRRYDRQGLIDLVRACDLDLLDSGYFFHSLYVASRLHSACGLQRSTDVVAPSTRWARMAHQMVGAVLTLERRLVPPAVPGSSLYAVAAVRR